MEKMLIWQDREKEASELGPTRQVMFGETEKGWVCARVAGSWSKPKGRKGFSKESGDGEGWGEQAGKPKDGTAM